MKSTRREAVYPLRQFYGTDGQNYPDNKIHGANMGLTWGRQDPGGPRVGPMNFAIWVLVGYMNNLA